jgi:RecA-family ATPase
MQSLAKGWRRSANAGLPLPSVYKSFDQWRIKFRRSATSMIAGVPGGMKSTLALNLLVQWARMGITGLYFSADADAFSVARNTAAILTHRTVAQVEAGMRGNSADYYNSALSAMDGTRFVYQVESIEDVDRHCRAFEAVYGKFPDVVFVDNLLNVDDSSEDWGSAREFLRNFEKLSREAECHGCVLHHTSESGYVPGVPQNRGAILGKLAQFPRVMLNVAPAGSVLNIAVVKSKDGPEFPGANEYFPLNIDAERMTLSDSGLYAVQGSFDVQTNIA